MTHTHGVYIREGCVAIATAYISLWPFIPTTQLIHWSGCYILQLNPVMTGHVAPRRFVTQLMIF